MNICKEIENNLNNKVNSSKLQIAKEVSRVLNISEDYLNKKLEYFFPVYIVRKSSLNLAIDMDMYNLPIEDLRIIEYLLDLMNEEDTLYIGSYIENKLATTVLQNSKRKYIYSYDHLTNEYSYYFEQEIYQGSRSCDLSLIYNLILSLGIDRHSFSNENEQLGYLYLIRFLSIMVTSNLQKDNVYLFDNKSISQSPETLLNSVEDYFKLFYNLFKDSIYLLILNYKEFVTSLGEDNFIEFTRRIKENELEDVDSLIYSMYKDYLEYTSGLVVDIEAIRKIKKYKKD